MMLTRLALPVLQRWLAEFPAVAILGPRQVGKTTLALSLANARPGATTYLDLESPADLAKLTDADAWLETHRDRLVILDEVQRMPELFARLRGVIDRRRRAGRRTGQFLLLGSAAGTLLRQSSESLAGRIAYLDLSPLIVPEVPHDAAQRLWIRGGFPESFLATDDVASLRWRQQFIATYLERDLPQLGPRVPATTLRRLWTMLAHEQGRPLDASRLAGALAVSGQTVARYVDLLVDLMLVRRLTPWTGNLGKRLVRSPRVYVRDSGLVHALLGLETFDDVVGHPATGGSWEGWVIENLLAVAPPGTDASFYRTSSGAEIDLLLTWPRGERWAIEIRRSSAPTLAKGFHIAADDVGATQRFVVHSGNETWLAESGVVAITVAEMQRRVAGQPRSR
jgi:hypothetical protein